MGCKIKECGKRKRRGVLNIDFEDSKWRYGWRAKLRIEGRERGGVLNVGYEDRR